MRNRRNSIYIMAWGETKHIAEWADDARARASISTIRTRLARGWSAEDAISKSLSASGRRSPIDDVRTTIAKGSHPSDPIIKAFNEEKYLWEWAEDFRCVVSKKTLWMRINDLGWRPEDALTKHLSSNNGIRYENKTILQLSKDPDCEVSYNTLANRLKSGIPLKDAFKKK